MIVTLAGGVGAARFLEGVVQVVDPAEVTAIVNTGDDMVMHGLYISPDLDIVMCTLADLIDRKQGWGIVDDSYNCMEWLTKLGAPSWFNLGDKDMALHIQRTALMAEGLTLAEITERFRKALGVGIRIVPMSNQPIPTHIITPQGEMHFEEYFVKHRAQLELRDIRFVGVEEADPTPGLLEAIGEAEMVLIAPSNPIVSVGTILSVPGVRAALDATNAPIVAVSPIVGGMAIKGPAVAMLQLRGIEATALGIARYYQGLIDALVIDNLDEALAPQIEALGIRAIVTDTIMRGPAEKAALAQTAIAAARSL
jgi:LPPG:FO 2-phospho-L-lactate transferase